MKNLLALLFALMLMPGLAQAQSISSPVFTPYVYAPVSADMVPSRHLSALIGKTAGTVCIIGDSTATAGPTAGNNVDESQIVWSGLQEKLRADNPQITSWTFANFAIGASNEAQPIQTGTATGLTLPSWFTVAGNTWLSYVQAQNCDVLFWQFGTNSSTAGLSAGSSASTFLRQDLEVVNGWTKVPNVIMVTTKSANPATDTSGDDSNSSAHKAQAAFHRTFAKSGAAGYTSFSSVTALGFGLVDLGRYFTARLDGHDPASQYFQSRPDCIVNGFALGTAAVVGNNATTVCTTTNGDFRLSFLIPGAGGTTIFNYGGGNAIRVGLTEFAGNYLRFAVGGSGNLVPRYILDGAISGAPSQVGTSVNTTAGQDIMITVGASGKHLQVWIWAGAAGGCTLGADYCGGTLALDVSTPRLISEATGGTPINVNFASAPANSPTINVTEFYEGIGAPTVSFTNYPAAFGFGAAVNTCAVTTAGCQGGNSVNHQRANSFAFDKQIIDALDFHVPPQILLGGTAFTTSGCSISATTGKGTAGTYTSGTTGTCTAVITPNGATAVAAPNGWACAANDLTTPADKQGQTASTTTTATIAGTTVTGDVVNFSCTPY